jgi:hypothetical protein
MTRNRPAPAGQNLELTPEELAEVLRDASSLQTREQESGRDITTLDGAIETARELGIGEAHVHAAAAKLRQRKDRLQRLRNISRTRGRHVLRFLGTMALVTTIVLISGGMDAAQATLFGMSIALVVMCFRWGRALLAVRYPDIFDSDERGECRVCGNRARDKKSFYCFEHMPERDR